MKQLFQDLNTGHVRLEEVPAPGPAPKRVLVQGTFSLISSGTERMLVSFGRASLWNKVRSQPDKVKLVRQKVKTDGLLPTLRAVQRKLSDPMPLGYCHVGRVVDAGPGIQGLRPGDRVLSNGPHAEVVSVPQHLCARIPDVVPDEEAVFGILGAIALQGIRLIGPNLGERVAVVGLGLVGQLAVQLLRANGCEVLAIDLDASKVALAESQGAVGYCPPLGTAPLAAASAFSHGAGVDAVLLAAATSSPEPLIQAAEMCRPRGRIVMVGSLPIQAPREVFYRKELSFQVSCSYGPGRYDPNYELEGHDYPIGHVRWTEQRNIEAILSLMAQGKLRCASLFQASFPLAEAPEAYRRLVEDRGGLGLLLRHAPAEASRARTLSLETVTAVAPTAQLGLALIGAGQHAFGTLLPAFPKGSYRWVVAQSSNGAQAMQAAKKFGFARATTRLEDVLEDPHIHAVVICTRHRSHASLAIKALEAGKHVFLEKPLALTSGELDSLQEARNRNPHLRLTLGFNRRFAPLVTRLDAALASRRGPLHLIVEINAGELPPDHWIHQEGGRLIGEGCHFVDLMRHWTRSPIRSFHLDRVGSPSQEGGFTLSLRFEDGSAGTLLYSALGHRAHPKETYTLYWEGQVARLDNFRRLTLHGLKSESRRAWIQDKGHRGLIHAWLSSLQGGTPPIPEAELFEVARVCIDADRSA